MKDKGLPPIVEASTLIRLDMPGVEQLTFMHSVLSQIGMPRSPVEGRRFERSNGGASLLVEAGEIWDGEKWAPQPIPYGPKPRVILADICNTAMRTNSRVIHLGETITEYLRHLGLTDQGGARGPLTAFRKQVMALAVCRMSLGLAYSENRLAQISGQPIEGFESWRDITRREPIQWQSTIMLSEQFWRSLQAHAVPLDMRAVRTLDSSALALDLYTWFAHRLHRLDKPLTLSWQALHDQFGQEYKNVKDFRVEVLRLLKRVLEVYPTAKVDPARGGLRFQPSPPPVQTQIIKPAWGQKPRAKPAKQRLLEAPAKPQEEARKAQEAAEAARQAEAERQRQEEARKAQEEQEAALLALETTWGQEEARKAQEEAERARKAQDVAETIRQAELDRESRYLKVPFAQKDEAKALGAWWDPDRRAWYVPARKDLAPFVRWLPKK